MSYSQTRIASEPWYYPGLLSTVFGIAGPASSFRSLGLANVIEPDYRYRAIAWIVSLLMFFGVVFF